MHENELARIVVDASLSIHRILGPGLLESVYETILAHELRKRGLHVETQVPIPIVWEDVTLDESFRADMIVEHKLLVELKSVEHVTRVFKKIVLTYVKLADKRLGLIINFGEELLKDGVSRIVNGLDESQEQKAVSHAKAQSSQRPDARR
jgi:GxxExxY protein